MSEFNILYEYILNTFLENVTDRFILARIADQEGIDLTTLNRAQYINYAEKHRITLDSDSIRMSPHLRGAFDHSQLQQLANTNQLNGGRDTRHFYRMSVDHQSSPGEEIMSGVVVHPETTTNQMWLFYEINGGLEEQRGAISKSYIGLKNVNYFQAKDWLLFLQKLQQSGFSGCVKTAQDPNTIKDTSDQIVMHGNTVEDANTGLRVAKEHFGTKVGFEDVGQDIEKDGRWYSHTQWLETQHQNRLRKH